MRLPAVSRADLLRCLVRGSLVDAAATPCGFRREQRDQPTFPQIAEKTAGDVHVSSAAARESTENLPDDEPTPRLKFLVPVEAAVLATDPVPPPRGIPITDAELAVNWKWRAPTLKPLVRWPRLEPYLRSRLGVVATGSALDLPRLMRLLGKGVLLHSLPRIRRMTWAAQALILWDDSPEMHGFAKDVSFLLQHLRRERGKHGLKVVSLKSAPHSQDLLGAPLGVPVLALSAMGNFRYSSATAAAWVAMARLLEYRGHAFHALNPCPRGRWQPDVTAAWPTAVWDRQPRLPRHGGLRHLGETAGGNAAAASTLLDWLSPATRIESGLLREARLSLGHGFDVGAEWDAWHHEKCWQAPDSFGFYPGDDYDARLARRTLSAKCEPALAEKIGSLITGYHGGCSSVIAAEAALRTCLSGSPDVASLADLENLLGKVVHRLRDLAAFPGSREGQQSGLARWFENMVDRLTPEMRSHTALADSIARGLALAKHFQSAARIDWPEGVDRAAATEESTSAISRLPAPANFQLIQQGNELAVMPQTQILPVTPLALLRASRPSLHLSIQAGPHGHVMSSTFHLPASLQRVPLVDFDVATSFQIETDRQRLGFAPITRPIWARRMWYDRYGLAAEFVVAGVSFVLRWIPPGRFLMGSPADEPGRWDPEGPQHERVLEKGFWLGEAPVTQAQWQAVTGQNPSRFKGPTDLPVEQVSWEDCKEYVRRLNALVVPGPGFRLPKEAEWEHACRAGTETALWTGGITLRGEYDAPELDEIAWYGGNSGQDLKVTNPYDSKDWKEKQYPIDKKAGSHAVRLRAANPWGLYDMLGNVWEWCDDPWDAEAYGKYVTGEKPIEGENGALRVVRGGSWSNRAQLCRAAFRSRSEPGARRDDLGLRLAAGQEQDGGAAGTGSDPDG